jgi:hypothetical protein
VDGPILRESLDEKLPRIVLAEMRLPISLGDLRRHAAHDHPISSLVEYLRHRSVQLCFVRRAEEPDSHEARRKLS